MAQTRDRGPKGGGALSRRGLIRAAATPARPSGTALSVLLTLCLAAPVAAQLPEPPRAPAAYRGALVGARAGIDYLFDGLVVGGQSHLLLDPWGRVVLMPNAEIEFRRGLTDWQLNGEAAVMPTSAVYVGAGVAYRNTVYDEAEGRETRSGYSIFVGLREPPSPGRMSVQAEIRWSYISHLRPRTVTLGINYPLVLWR